MSHYLHYKAYLGTTVQEMELIPWKERIRIAPCLFVRKIFPSVRVLYADIQNSDGNGGTAPRRVVSPRKIEQSVRSIIGQQERSVRLALLTFFIVLTVLFRKKNVRTCPGRLDFLGIFPACGFSRAPRVPPPKASCKFCLRPRHILRW